MKRIPRALRWILGGLVVFEIAYVAAGVYLVRSGQVDRWLNKHPDKRVIRFESAWTVIPGVAHVRGFRMVNQGRSNQLELKVDRAGGFVNPVELLARRVHVVGLRARGVEFRFRKRPRTPEEATAREAVEPPIEGLPFEPYDGPPKQKKTKPGWTVAFTGATVREVRDVWMGPFRLRGAADVAASVNVGPGDDKLISIRRADIRYYSGTFLSEGQISLRDLALRVRGRMEPFFTKQTRGKALMSLISARAEFAGTSPGATLLNQYFARASWIEFDSEPRRVTARVEVEKGRIRPGSHVDLAQAPLHVELAGFFAGGQATVRLETVASDRADAADLQVAVTYMDYGMQRVTEGAPVMRGTGLRIDASSPADLAQFPPDDLDARIDLGEAEFPDLTFVNDLLPGGAGLTVKGGRGKVDGHFETGRGFACRGEVTVTTKDLVVDAGGVENTGNVKVTVEVPDGNLGDLRFDLGRTRTELRRFSFTSRGSEDDTRDWEGRIAVAEGTLDLGATPGADVRLDLTFSDTRPLVAFLSRDKPLRGWKERLLTVEEISGEAVASLQGGTMTIRHFGLHSGKLDVRFRARVDSGGAVGKARARYGALKAGIGLQGQERKLKVLRVGTWYRKEDIPGMPPLLPEFDTVGSE